MEISVKLTCLHGIRLQCHHTQKYKPCKPKFGHEESQVLSVFSFLFFFFPTFKFLKRYRSVNVMVSFEQIKKKKLNGHQKMRDPVIWLL